MSMVDFLNYKTHMITARRISVVALLSIMPLAALAEVDDPVQTRQSGDGQPGAQRRVRRRFEREQLAPPSRKKIKAEDRKPLIY